MANDLIIVGCGGFGREVVGIVDAINAESVEPAWNLLGFVDDAPGETNLDRIKAIGLGCLGTTEDLISRLKSSEVQYVIAVGLPQARRDISSRIGHDESAATLIDPDARIGRDARIGHGVVVAAGAHVTTNVEVGRHVHVDRAVQVGHDSTLGDFATVHPGSVISGNCQVGERVELGSNCTLLPGITVASAAIIGAGACVTKDVIDGQTVKGVPAR